MKNAIKSEAETIASIEMDLVGARREGRFEDALHHLDELFVIFKHSESDPARTLCAALLAAPETLQKAA
jgi:hypothetical protein